MATHILNMKKITFDIEDETYSRVEKLAEKNDRSVSAELRVIIKRCMDK